VAFFTGPLPASPGFFKKNWRDMSAAGTWRLGASPRKVSFGSYAIVLDFFRKMDFWWRWWRVTAGWEAWAPGWKNRAEDGKFRRGSIVPRF